MPSVFNRELKQCFVTEILKFFNVSRKLVLCGSKSILKEPINNHALINTGWVNKETGNSVRK